MFANDSCAVVYVDFTSVASEANFARTFESVASTRARGTVATGVCCTRVGFESAIGSRISYRAYAHVAAWSGFADSAIRTGLIEASQSTGFTAGTLVTLGTGTGQLSAFVGDARASVETGPHCARM